MYNKIGFHCGPIGNHTGLGNDFEKPLDASGIPIFLKSADSYGQLQELLNLAAASGVAHTAVYRLSTAGQDDGYDYDVPPYHLSPSVAASVHWNATKAKLPPEFDKARCWLEVCNEVDKNLSSWLGQWAQEMATLALGDGYRIALFGWSSGEPGIGLEHPNHWDDPNMLDFLRLCAVYPKRLAVSLHEYDFGLEGYDAVYPFHYGRFQWLFDAADRHSIPRPTVLITEWGWALNHVPTWTAARPTITRANELYNRYPQILGADIWNLGAGAGFGNVADETQKLIAPLGQYALVERFETGAENEPLDPAYFNEQPPLAVQTRSFEDGHTDHPLHPDRIQIPTGFQVSVIEPDFPLWYPRKGQVVNATGTVEAKRLNCSQLPPTQCVGGSDPLIIKGEWNYKVQAVNMQSGTAVSTVFTGDGRCRVTVPIDVHWQVDVPREADDVYVVLLLNGVEVDRLQHPELKDRQWMELTGEAELPVSVELRFQTSWPNSRDCFTDYWQCETMEEPPMGNYKSVVFKLAQEHTREEWQAIAGIAYDEYKRTMTASHDNCIVMVGDGNEESYAVVFDPQLPSQQTAIAALQEAGLIIQTRPFRG